MAKITLETVLDGQAAIEDGLLLNGGTVFLNAHEEVKIPFRFYSVADGFLPPPPATMQVCSPNLALLPPASHNAGYVALTWPPRSGRA